jgi:predicted site-specific integrase-resolvase
MLWLNSKEYCSKYKISNTTLKRWVDDGKIKCNKVSSRKFLYLDQNIEEDKKLNVVYSRVSNTNQKEDLNRQIDLIKNYMIYNGYIVDQVFKDIASGMNEDRLDFNKLINMVLENKISNIFISTKDRLSRFGYEYLKNIFNKYNCNIVILDNSDTKTYENELTDDLLTIIHHFSMKYYSKRRILLKNIKKSLENSKNEF